MTNSFKQIGIVGGAGPMASSFLYASILEFCQKKYHANDYNEFPEIILVSYPFTRGNGEKIQEEIALCLAKLKGAGASLFCMASHSFHGYLPHFPHTGFIHLVKETLGEASLQNISKALILAAPLTIQMKLYETSPMQCLYPPLKEQEQINQLIRQVAGGKADQLMAQEVRQIIAQIHSHSPFDGIVIACTELSIIQSKLTLTEVLPIINPIDVLISRLFSKMSLT